MKIVLTINEVVQIVGNHLVSIGKLEPKTTNVHWCMDNINTDKSYVEFEQIVEPEHIKE